MLLANLDSIDASYLQQLCSDRWPESPTLDFKRDIPTNQAEEKTEFLKDISALANTDGGDLVYGIAEADGTAESIKPIAGESADAAIRRFAQVLDGGIEPRIQGVRFRAVDVEGGYVFIIRVPASFEGPHGLRVGSSRRFVTRNGTGTSDMSFDQLRNAFDRTATLGERAARFIQDRQSAIIDGRGARRLADGPIAVVHFVPLAGLAGRQTIDWNALYRKDFVNFVSHDWGGGSRTFNLDGIVVHPGGKPANGDEAYAQIFRTGAVEAVRMIGGTREFGNKERNIIFSGTMTDFYRESLNGAARHMANWGLQGPALVGVSLLRVEGYELGVGQVTHRSPVTSDRPHLILPHVWVPNLETLVLDEVARPVLDTIWQAFDMQSCYDYDDNGKYSPRNR